MKRYFVYKNRNNVNEGYVEVDREYAKNYMANYDGVKPMFIDLGDLVLETDNKELYLSHRKEYNHKHYNYLNKIKYKTIYTSQIEEDEFIGKCTVASPDEDFEERAISNILFHQVLKCIYELDEIERDIIMLVYYEGKSEREAAEILGIPQTTLNYQKKKAIHYVKGRMLQ